MQRLFSTFPEGSPGIGLLFLRVGASIPLIHYGIAGLSGAPVEPLALDLSAAIAGIALLAGLWTPIAGTVVVLIELLTIFLHVGDPWIYILLGTLGAAIALLGPGGWSVDARLFGWRRVELPDLKS